VPKLKITDRHVAVFFVDDTSTEFKSLSGCVWGMTKARIDKPITFVMRDTVVLYFFPRLVAIDIDSVGSVNVLGAELVHTKQMPEVMGKNDIGINVK